MKPYGKAYWESIARSKTGYSLEENIAKYKIQEHLDIFNKWVSKKNLRVLKTDLFEEAFGPDSFLSRMTDYETFGIDISPTIVIKAKKRFGDSNKLNQDTICKTSFKPKYFDIIFSNSTLDHLKKKDVENALKEINRIMKKKGTLLLTLDNKHNPFYRFGYLISSITGMIPYHQEKCYSFSEAEQILQQAGFRIEDKTAIVHVITPFNKIALILKRFFPNSKSVNNFIINSIKLFSRLGRLKTRNYTGWFIALKCKKK